ncbi:hypothetical protein ANCCAN_16051 [Ancylostoma caninum]|uniref:C-type lectin domain-containing protein n=1 Tax=Ancylostoma caninum TaxID=29170 RepID=A0A368G4V1_ANCCA|nr:hypothetical protein ANCCAN_16051 [Ancylostoma caninum]
MLQIPVIISEQYQTRNLLMTLRTNVRELVDTYLQFQMHTRMQQFKMQLTYQVAELLQTNSGGKIILGYSNLINYGFSWSDGNPSTYTNWAPGEPVTAVAGVAWMDMLTGWWNTAAPFATSHFICALPAYRSTC